MVGPNETVLTKIDNLTDAAPLWWQINTYNSDGSDANCVYLGRPRGLEHPTTAILHGPSANSMPQDSSPISCTEHNALISDW